MKAIHLYLLQGRRIQTNGNVIRTSNPDFGSFVTSRLSCLASILEHLDLVYRKDIGNQGDKLIFRIKPVEFKQFVELRTLTMPHALLTGNGSPVATDCLPSSLETLNVTRVDSREFGIWDMLESVADSKDCFKALKHVQLTPHGTEELKDLDVDNSVKILQDVGIDVFVEPPRKAKRGKKPNRFVPLRPMPSFITSNISRRKSRKARQPFKHGSNHQAPNSSSQKNRITRIHFLRITLLLFEDYHFPCCDGLRC